MCNFRAKVVQIERITKKNHFFFTSLLCHDLLSVDDVQSFCGLAYTLAVQVVEKNSS